MVSMVFPASPVTVVMIHGAGGGGWEYDKWRPVFERRGWKVINRDLVPTGGKYALTKLSDYVKQVVSWCPKDGHVVLVGASMGGRLALEASPKVRPLAIVLVNSVPPEGHNPRKFPPLVKWANEPLKDTVDSMPDSDEPTIRWAWKRWRDESGSVMEELSKGGKIQTPTCPVIVVIGENDTDVPPKLSHRMAHEFHATILSYPAMSHVGPLLSRSAEKVAGDVADELAKHLPGG
jgi:pimeloyl-ACP methyl ester carboxylesterase